ncbi:DUF1007 family protein [Salipiger aestuarii]|uniref:DUF1007 family protein n=1 Tax=Salipiger aestuarii TaxID=568098 RepID=UPI0035CA2EEE
MRPGKNAGAHPHIFVDARTGLLVNERGQLDVLRVSWTCGAFTTLFLFDVLDLDTGTAPPASQSAPAKARFSCWPSLPTSTPSASGLLRASRWVRGQRHLAFCLPGRGWRHAVRTSRARATVTGFRHSWRLFM